MLKNNFLLALAGSVCIGATLSAQPSFAAETVSLRYGPFQTSVPVSDLKEYAKTGEPSERLETLLAVVSQKQREDLRRGLNFKAPMNVVAADKLLSSPLGSQLLGRFTKIIVFRPAEAGLVAMQGGMLMAAASPEGLGVMSFIENYPGSVIEIDVKEALKDGASLGAMFQGMTGR